MKRDDSGYIVVETMMSFLLLVLLILSILSLINIVAVQSRIHYAITQTAETLSLYDYTLEITGTADIITGVAKKSEKTQSEINEFKNNIDGLLSGIESLSPSEIGGKGEAVINQGKRVSDTAISDPKSVFQMLISYSVDEGGRALFGTLVRPLVGHYLSNGTMSGDEFLKAFHVINGLEGLQFYQTRLTWGGTGEESSTFLNSDGDVKITVQYDIDYSFGALQIPFNEPKLHITQEVMTKAWLNGHGDGYKP